MTPEQDTWPLVLNTAEQRFELQTPEGTAFIAYRQEGDKVFLIHTEVPEGMEGRGIGAVIAEKTFRYLEEHELRMVPYCPFILVYLKRHPAWKRLLASPAPGAPDED